MKSSDHRRTGARNGRLPNRQGWFIIWYETRENKKGYHVIADPSHTLAFAPAPRRGLRVIETPPPDNPFSAFVAKDDIILKDSKTAVMTYLRRKTPV